VQARGIEIKIEDGHQYHGTWESKMHLHEIIRNTLCLSKNEAARVFVCQCAVKQTYAPTGRSCHGLATPGANKPSDKSS